MHAVHALSSQWPASATPIAVLDVPEVHDHATSMTIADMRALQRCRPAPPTRPRRPASGFGLWPRGALSSPAHVVLVCSGARGSVGANGYCQPRCHGQTVHRRAADLLTTFDRPASCDVARVLRVSPTWRARRQAISRGLPPRVCCIRWSAITSRRSAPRPPICAMAQDCPDSSSRSAATCSAAAGWPGVSRGVAVPRAAWTGSCRVRVAAAPVVRAVAGGVWRSGPRPWSTGCSRRGPCANGS